MVKARDYKQERITLLARGEDKGHAERLRARRAAEKAGKVSKGDGKDLAHKRALSRGGSSSAKNLAVQTPSENRSFARNSDGSMKSEKSKRERK